MNKQLYSQQTKMKQESQQQIKLEERSQREESEEMEQQSSTSLVQKYQDKKTQLSELLKLYEHSHQTKFITTIQNPLDVIQQLLLKLDSNKKKLNEVTKKYTEIQIQANTICSKFPPAIRESIKNGFQECLSYHNVWSSKNNVVLMKTDSPAVCQVGNNEINLIKRKNQKLNTVVALLNKIPENCVVEVKLYLSDLHNSFKFAKEDYIRLKIYPQEEQFRFGGDSVRCLTVDSECLEKQCLINDDKITFKLDMFHRKAKAYCNDKLIKYSEQIKMKKVQIKSYNFIPAVEICLSERNKIKKLNLYVQLDFLYKDV